MHGLAGLLIGFACAFAASLPAIASGVPSGGVLDFAVLRNGDAIGHHIFRFEQKGAAIDVRVEAKIDYRLGFIPLYHFRHEANEKWRNGMLTHMSARTDDNGEEFEIEVRPGGDGLTLSVNGETAAIGKTVIPASLWNNALIEQTRILDPADGEIMAVEIALAGNETIAIQGREVPVRHYVMTGDFERNLWYDVRGILMQVRFKGDDGSEILYQLR